MKVKNRLFALAGAALFLSGCNLNLDPFPEPMHPGGKSWIGLNPFPSPVNGRHVPLANAPTDDPLDTSGSTYSEAPEVDPSR